ncbi:MAG: phosphatidate cytidylyltransferase [Deltaproteobacteria bacterium]|nr:phosphatidate cytidylyltransferase [Deltaproteobacteria bacterium]
MAHLNRWVTSLAALPLLGLLIILGGRDIFAIFIAVVAVISLWEYFRIINQIIPHPIPMRISVWGYFAGLVIVLCAHFLSFQFMILSLSSTVLIAGVLSLRQFSSLGQVPRIIGMHTLGVVYIPLALAYLVLIRNSTDGIYWVVLIVGIVFGGDVGAFYVGTYFGRRKLCPNVSPGKTIEGALGGLATSLLVGGAGKWLLLPDLSWAKILVFSIVLGVTGQVGDLFESMLKRTAGVKDSSALLPGHGGVLDRIDALLFAVPMAYFLLIVFS